MSEQASVLVVSPYPEDHLRLAAMLPKSHWNVRHAFNWTEGEQMVRKHRYLAVLSESVMEDYRWDDVYRRLSEMFGHKAPLLIVASSLADERLWGEALNLGAYNVLAKPFDRKEVCWVLGNAQVHREQKAKAAAASGSFDGHLVER